jgi:hypothetical protein
VLISLLDMPVADKSFINIFLKTHSYFLDSTKLLEKLMDRFSGLDRLPQGPYALAGHSSSPVLARHANTPPPDTRQLYIQIR